ncbi:MAG: amidohydrolase family protein [Coriobacteriia bacterium]|nr:amidohydrolase family protein [Coriobacteriia bacterium]
MLITADWVLPVSRPPIRHGAVLVEHGIIVEVGSARELERLKFSGEHRHFPGCAVTPGLVNAHTHLSLTALGGLLESTPFEEWLPRLVRAMSDWGPEEFAASAALGSLKCLQAGVTVVGDVAYGPEAPAAAADAGLAGVFFWEVLGVSAPRLYAELEKREFPVTERGWCGTRLRCGLSPHAPYTCEPRLIAAVHEASVEFGIPFAMHVAESSAEVELLAHGTGPLAEAAARLVPGFSAPGSSPIAYVDRLDALDGCTVIHACHAEPSDIARLAAAARGVVTCPRSNLFLHNPIAPVARILRAGVPVGVGTDSAASNSDLNLMEELRCLHHENHSIKPSQLIEMVTVMGALALGLEDRFGILETGMQADMAAFEIGETSDPESDFVKHADATTLRGVMSSGIWRVLDGELIEPIAEVARSAQAARIRAEHALTRT